MNDKLHDTSSDSQNQGAEAELRRAALGYHHAPTCGKTEVRPTKVLISRRDLSLAYSLGVAYPRTVIKQDPSLAAECTLRGNLVGVIINDTAVLGPGDIGPLANKPVMKGKGCLFKKFIGVDVFDIELAECDPDKLVNIIVSLEPTLGGINLEDVRVLECFYIEQRLRDRLNVPVFHDDQHGTAIISSVALLNGLKTVGKDIDNMKVAVSGAGVAAIACLDAMIGLGVKHGNVYVVDSKGMIYANRDAKMEPNKARYAQDTSARMLADIVRDVDVFSGCSAAGVLTASTVKTMASKPIILVLANPEPEIRLEVVKAARPDCIIATGHSDYPNRVNNVLCFPYIFRDALDCGATKITEEMRLACVKAIAELAEAETNDAVAQAYAGQDLAFGPDYITLKPFDLCLIEKTASAVAKAMEESGVVMHPTKDPDAYRARPSDFVYHTGLTMRPVSSTAKASPKHVAYAEGKEERVLRAVQTAVDEGLAKPILIGRPHVIEMHIQKAGLRLKPGVHSELVDPENDRRYHQYYTVYYKLMGHNGVTSDMVKSVLRCSNTLTGVLLVRLGDADVLLCGTISRFDAHLEHVRDVIGLAPSAKVLAAMNGLILEKHTLSITDTFVNELLSAEELADITKLTVEGVRRLGQEPKVAMLSYLMFGSSRNASTRRACVAYDPLKVEAPDLQVEGEIQGDAALSGDIRYHLLPESAFSGNANLLVMSSFDATNIAFNLPKVTGGQGVMVGPILSGAAKPVHVLDPSATSRCIVNMTALAVVDVSATR